MATGQDDPTANEKPRFGAADDPPIHDRLLLRINEVAHILGIGRTSVYELVAKGELPVVRIGRSVRIRLLDLETWVDGRVEFD